MTRNTLCQNKLPPTYSSESDSIRTLVIGDIRRWALSGRNTASFDNFSFCTQHDLTPDLLRNLCPEMILSPLVGDTFDALDIAAILRRLGYKGRYRAITPFIPSAAIVVAEFATIAPAIDFDLFVMPSEQS